MITSSHDIDTTDICEKMDQTPIVVNGKLAIELKNYKIIYTHIHTMYIGITRYRTK